jgi:hypothetical protein
MRATCLASHSTPFDHPNNVCLRIKITELRMKKKD